MDKNQLLKTAHQLQQIDKKFANEYASKRELLVEKMNTKMISRPDVLDMVGENNIDMMKDNHANHARFLESIFYQHSPEILVDTIIWVFKAYQSRNFNSTYWAAQMNQWIEIYKKELSPECFEAISPYYYWMQINIPIFNKLAVENIEASNSAH